MTKAVVTDEPRLVMDVLARLTGAHSVADCFEVWRELVHPDYRSLSQDTIDDLERGVLFCVERIAKPRR
jgi:hypothetical protein